MRKYEGTHPWITFRLNVGQISWETWSHLGEIRASVTQMVSVALRPAVAQRLHRLYLAKGVLATTAIEGNTLSEEEVERILAGELELPPSKEYLATEVKNIETACNQIWEKAFKGDDASLTLPLISQFNRWIRKGLPEKEETAPPGTIRSYSVGVLRYRGAPAEDCAYLVERLCEWLSHHQFSGPKAHKVEFAVLRAIIAHLYLAWIHPFGDGNGRTARLVEFYILVNAGLPTPCAHLLSNHYNQTRTEYYRQLDYASRSGGNIIPFISYAIQGFVDGLRDQLDVIRKELLDIAWISFVHELFRDRGTSAGIRQRRLVLALSRNGKAIPFTRLSKLTPELAVEYAKRSKKTLRRDINALIKMELVVDCGNDIYWANTNLMLAFQPHTKDYFGQDKFVTIPVDEIGQSAEYEGFEHQTPISPRLVEDVSVPEQLNLGLVPDAIEP